MNRPAPGFVVDASVGAKLALPEEGAEAAHEVFLAHLEGRIRALHVPDHFFAECGHAFRRGVMRHGLDPRETILDLEALVRSGLESTPVRDLAPAALALAHAMGLSVHDACYVALSDSTGLPLLTADRKLLGRLANTRHRVRELGAWHRVE